jgi:hypothetical protein
MRKLFLAPDAQTRLLQVIRLDEESMLIAVAVHQRFAFIVVAVSGKPWLTQPTPMSYAPYSVMPCQVSVQSVVANSWPLAQASRPDQPPG